MQLGLCKETKMKKSEIRKIIKEEIQRLNEVKGYENLSSLPEK